MLEVLHRERFVDRLPGLLLVFLHEVGAEVAHADVQRVVHRGEVAAEPLDLAVDEVVADLGHGTGMAVEVRDVVACRLRPVVPVPAGVEDDDVALADLLALRKAAEHVFQRVIRPGLRDRSQVDHEGAAVQLGERDLTQVFAGRPVVDGRVDVRARVHVRAHEHRALAVPVVGRDVGHLDRLELGPGRHPVAPRLGEVHDPH